MATQTFGVDTDEVIDNLDSIVNKKVIADLPGGAFLNAEEWQEPVIKAGHIIIRNKTTKECLPLDVDSSTGAYKSLPETCEYFGTLRKSVQTKKPLAAVVLAGIINEEACPYSIPSGFKTAIPSIRFI